MQAAQFLQSCVYEMQKRPTLRLGSQGRALSSAVREWQTLMQREMGASIKVDGVFGHDTRAATAAFQRKVGLPPDGVVGPKTWAAAAVAPCYALALAKSGAAGSPAAQSSRMAAIQTPTHGLGDLSFSALDVKSMALGVVLGVGVGFVLFRRK